MIPAGKLNRSITLEREAKTVAPSGAVASVWHPFATVRAQVLTATTEELLHGFGALDSSLTVFRVRWRDDVTTADRITVDGTSYEIDRIAEHGQRAGLDLHGKAVA